MLETLLPFITASVLLTLSPGPDIIYVLTQSICNGKKTGIITALGLATGIIVHTSLVAFGISALIKKSETIFLIIKIAGAAYLLFLAFKVYKSEAEFSLAAKGEVAQKPFFSLFKTGFIMNVLNPKVTIFFLAFFPGFLWVPEENTVLQFYVLGAIFMLQAFLIFSLVAILAGKIAVFLKQKNRSAEIFKWVQISVFIGIALFILI